MAKQKAKFSLFLKFTVIISISLLIVMSVFGLVVMKIQRDALISEKEKSSQELVDFVAGISARHIEKMSYYSLYESTEFLQAVEGINESEILSVVITDSEGKMLNLNGISTEDISVPEKFWLTVQSDCVFIDLGTEEETTVGSVTVIISKQSIYEKIRRTTFFFILATITALILLDIVLLFVVQNLVVDKLSLLSESAEEIAGGNFDVQIDVHTNDEIGLLAGNITQMAGDLKKSFDEVADLNEHLELKVEERTREVRELYEQQNGDYYLTSLLIEPLASNMVNSNNVKVDFYLEQKKKFDFRKWNSQLGGDLNVASSIMLRGKKYSVFANTDAMGKSMQGAGGALVFGTSFNSYIQRTISSLQAQDKSAGDWLGECYDELQALFETFDGSMMVSGIFGILNEYTGVLRFFNVEHPWLVLYRGGEAHFIDDEGLTGRKLGSIGFSGVTIQKFQMEPGDILISGSDGRDDLKIGEDEETGRRVINEDEKLFLDVVERGKGELNAIVEILKELGELTDDLSLLRVEFTGTEDFSYEEGDMPLDLKRQIDVSQDFEMKKPLKGESERVKKFRRLDKKRDEAFELYNQKNYRGAVKILSTLEGHYDRAKDNFAIYNLMGYCHFKMKDYREALFSWREALEMDPENETLVKNIKVIEDFLSRNG